MLLFNVAVFLALPLLAFAKIIMGPFSYAQGTFTVSWTAAADAPPSFDILLRKGAQRIPLVSDINSSLGTYTYSIPNTTPAGTNYKIQFVVHDPTDPTPEILDTSPAFSVQASDFNPTSASVISVASTSSVSGAVSASASSSSASVSSVSGVSVTGSLISSLQSSASTALASLTAMTGSVTATITSGSSVVTTTLNAASATASAVSQSVASVISSASVAATSSATPSGAESFLVSWVGLVVSTVGVALGTALLL